MLYIHIPFCDYKCGYCSFNSIVDKGSKRSYFDALKTQLKKELQLFKPLTSVYIGGGTPSCIEAEYYEEIFKIIFNHSSNIEEITVEANPKSGSYQWFLDIHGLGVNRLSLGFQSFNDKKLELLTRAHTKNEAIESFFDARKAGFENISIDLIYDTALDSAEILKEELEGIGKLNPEHLSAYSLIIEDSSGFRGKLNKKQDNEELQKLYVEELAKLLPQYEISNFGKIQSRHNRGYWKYNEYLGVGAGAVGRVENCRYYPHKNIQDYIAKPLFRNEEILSSSDMKLEKIFLGLRADVGFSLDILSDKEKEKIEILEREGKIKIKEQKVYNSDYFLSDEIALFIME